MEQKKHENIALSIALKRTRVSKNIIYLKKTKKVNQNDGTLDQYLQVRPPNAETIEKEDDSDLYHDE